MQLNYGTPSHEAVMGTILGAVKERWTNNRGEGDRSLPARMAVFCPHSESQLLEGGGGGASGLVSCVWAFPMGLLVGSSGNRTMDSWA